MHLLNLRTTLLKVIARMGPSAWSKLATAVPLTGALWPPCPPTTKDTKSSSLMTRSGSITMTSSGETWAGDACRFFLFWPDYEMRSKWPIPQTHRRAGKHIPWFNRSSLTIAATSIRKVVIALSRNCSSCMKLRLPYHAWMIELTRAHTLHTLAAWHCSS